MTLNAVSFFQAPVNEGDEEISLFTEYLHKVPRVGEFVSYSFEPHDRAKWAQDSLDYGDRAGKLVNNWRVVEVHHLVRRLSVIQEAIQSIAVYLEPATKDDNA